MKEKMILLLAKTFLVLCCSLLLLHIFFTIFFLLHKSICMFLIMLAIYLLIPLLGYGIFKIISYFVSKSDNKKESKGDTTEKEDNFIVKKFKNNEKLLSAVKWIVLILLFVIMVLAIVFILFSLWRKHLLINYIAYAVLAVIGYSIFDAIKNFRIFPIACFGFFAIFFFVMSITSWGKPILAQWGEVIYKLIAGF